MQSIEDCQRSSPQVKSASKWWLLAVLGQVVCSLTCQIWSTSSPPAFCFISHLLVWQPTQPQHKNQLVCQLSMQHRNKTHHKNEVHVWQQATVLITASWEAVCSVLADQWWLQHSIVWVIEQQQHGEQLQLKQTANNCPVMAQHAPIWCLVELLINHDCHGKCKSEMKNAQVSRKQKNKNNKNLKTYHYHYLMRTGLSLSYRYVILKYVWNEFHQQIGKLT